MSMKAVGRSITCGDAAAANGVLDVPLEAKDVDGSIPRDAESGHVNQSAHASITHRRAEILVRGEIDARRARGSATHVVRGRDNLIDAAACLGESRHIEQVHGGPLGFRRQLGEPPGIARERTNRRPRID